MVKPQTTKLSSVVMFLAKKCSSKALKPLAFLENNSSFFPWDYVLLYQMYQYANGDFALTTGKRAKR